MSDPWERLVAIGYARPGVHLGSLTTYKLGGPASYYVEVSDRAQLEAVSESLSASHLPVLVLGRGSNLVISDDGWKGVVVRLGRVFDRIEIADRVQAGGSAGLPQVARAATGKSRRRLEFMIGIPGSIGGGVRQNAGCFGTEIADVLESAEIFDLATGTARELGARELAMSYRRSNVTASQVVLGATFRTDEGDAVEGGEIIRDITRWRRLHQPGGTLNAGSVFKNPPGDAAGRIIDSLGLKGTAVGGASVSEKHANFFVAMPGTRANDVYLLVQMVKREVRDRTGIDLEPEIQFAGHFPNGGGE